MLLSLGFSAVNGVQRASGLGCEVAGWIFANYSLLSLQVCRCDEGRQCYVTGLGLWHRAVRAGLGSHLRQGSTSS